MLALGVLAHTVKINGDVATQADHQAADDAVDFLLQQLREVHTPETITTLVAALGNAGFAATADDLMPYMHHTGAQSIQLAAVKGVRRMPKQDAATLKYREAVASKFEDPTTDRLVRMQALRTLFGTDPSDDELHRLSWTGVLDGDLQIQSFTRRSVRDLRDNSATPTLRRTARGILDDIEAAGGVVDFSGTNLTQLQLRLGFGTAAALGVSAKPLLTRCAVCCREG